VICLVNSVNERDLNLLTSYKLGFGSVRLFGRLVWVVLKTYKKRFTFVFLRFLEGQYFVFFRVRKFKAITGL